MLLVVSSASEGISPDLETFVYNAQEMQLGMCRELICKLEITNLVASKRHTRKLPKYGLALSYRITLENLK